MAVVATLSKGHDLEYIWKQVDLGPVRDAAGYYSDAVERVRASQLASQACVKM